MNVVRWFIVFAVAAWSGHGFAQEEPSQEAGATSPSSVTSLAERHLEAARRLYRELDFSAAVSAADEALAVPGVSASQRLEAHELRGAALVVLERDAEATAAFEAMLRLDPYHRVREPSGSPKIARFVEALRRRVVPDARLGEGTRIYAELPEEVRRDGSAPVRVDVECEHDPCPRPSQVQIFARSTESTRYEAHALDGDGTRFDGEVPVPSELGRLALYAEARDAQGHVLARAGEPLAPLFVEVSERGSRRTLRRWAITVSALVVVAAGAVALSVALGQERSAPGTLDPGRVELP